MIAFRWRYRDSNPHINVFEAGAARLATTRMSSRPLCRVLRCVLFVDSAVLYGALRKGRSSSFQILSHLRFLCALQLTFRLVRVPLWIPSALNLSRSGFF